MYFSGASFIKPARQFERAYSETNPAPIYAKAFTLASLPKKAELAFCALGMGYAYINGKRVSEDLFMSPPSNYDRTLWYVKYDVTSLLQKGENLIVFLCGNGFLNEDCDNAWDSPTATWRDFPKVIAALWADGEQIAVTDGTWRVAPRSPYLMNRLRLGVTYDARIPAPETIGVHEISAWWESAIVDDRAPQGELCYYDAEPVRECETFAPVSVKRTGEGRYLYDFGVNSSGYVRVRTAESSGTTLTLRYVESLDANGDLFYNDMLRFYHQGEFQTERLICNGEVLEWSTLFSFYGFRYVEVSGVESETPPTLTGVFTHQDIARKSGFSCSEPRLEELFACGIRSSYSNMFFMPTDCPTREKYGWMNDAQSSAEQFLVDFDAIRMLKMWNRSICDAVDDEKGLPGIVPTHGWGYNWGNGPVSDGSLFEQAYRIYLHSGDGSDLCYNLPYFRRYLAFLKRKENADGFVDFGLFDWVHPISRIYSAEHIPVTFINAVYRVKFNRIAALAARLGGEDDREFCDEEKRQIALIKKHYMDESGRCKLDEQTALAMLIYHGVYEELEPLAAQLKALVEKNNYHHECGMVGIRHLYMALNRCGLHDHAYRILTAEGYPSYFDWLKKGVSTLCETWKMHASQNHHMLSDFMSWIMKTVVGISPDDNAPIFDEIEVDPVFIDALDYASGYHDSPRGRVACAWKRAERGKILLSVTAPCDGYVRYKGEFLPKGISEFIV